MFDVKTFRKALTTQWLGQSLLFFEELHSTNTHIKQLSSKEISHGLLCLTDHQTHGRGQYEKKWESQPGQNLTFTLAFLPARSNRFHIFTLACARCIVEELEDATDFEAYIKWPNDVYIEDQKIGGLLTETTFSGNKIDRLLVGIGLNINQERFPGDLQGKATSLFQLTGGEYSRELFLAKLLSRIEYAYGRWHKHDASLLKEINQKVIGYGRWIKLQVGSEVRDDPAKLLGINEQGRLIVVNQEGELESFSYEQIRVVTD